MNDSRWLGITGLALSIIPWATGLTMEWFQPS